MCASDALEEVHVNFDELLLVFRDSRLFKNGSDRAGGFARAAVNAFIGINVKLLSLVKSIFALRRMNAVYRANIDTRSVFHTNTGLSDYVCHGLNILLLASATFHAAVAKRLFVMAR